MLKQIKQTKFLIINQTFQERTQPKTLRQMPTTQQIYSELKQQGLILSEATEIILPPILPPKQTLLGQLSSIIVPQQNYETEPYQLILVPVLNNSFIIARSNTLMCFKYQLQPTSQKPVITRPFVINLKTIITNVHICDPKYLSDRGEIPFLTQHKNELTLYYLDLKNNQIITANTLGYSNIVSVRFISQKQLLILSSLSANTNKYLLHHCYLQNGKIKQKIKFNPQLEINDNQIIKKIDIAGNIDEQQESTVCIFYFSILKENNDKKYVSNKDSQIFSSTQNSQILKVKEFLRDLDGNLTIKKNYQIIATKNQNLLSQDYQIKTYNGFYAFANKQQILIVKKKFDRYLFIDNVIEKVGGHTLTYHQKGIVSSQHGSSMELNIIFFNDPKCYSKLLDSIEVSQQLSQGFMMLWPFKIQKMVSLMFAFRKQKRLILSSLIKMDPIQKMVFVVQNSPKQKIPMIQQIALNLGISKKDFYLSQWMHSKRQIHQIHQFLLHCDDISNIKKQLRSTLRKKKIQVSEFIKILQKISKIIKNQLKENLSQHLLIQYLKNDFLLRKIKLKESNWKIDFKQLDRIYNSSLTDMFVQIVKAHLFPQKQMLDPLHAMVSAPIKQEMSLKHVFQVFRIPILYEYNRFLIRFVSQFSPQQIVSVFKHYSFLLPVYEFNPDLVIHKPEFETEVQLQQKVQQKMFQKPNIQEQQFANITSMQFSREMSRQRLEKQLHDFYPTSKINEALNFLVNSDFGMKMKLHKHGLITSSMLEYKQKLKDISGIKIYLKLCEFVNQYNLTSEEQKDNLSKDIVQILKQQNKLEGQAYEIVRLYTQIHRFMLQHNFFEKKKISVQQLVQLTSQDLVALFFLQNKQRKEFIFRQFRQIFINLYNSPKQFNEVIQKFICSQNCSRIELQIFIHEIKSQHDSSFQYDNQELIEIIIDGYCKKLELRQENDTQRFLDIMQDIELRKKLAMKINKIYKIRQCFNVFVIFNCEKETYYKILKYEQNNEIFRILLQRYFTGQIRANFIRIDDQDVPLEYCRNMLNVLLYLQDSVYYDVGQKELLLIYCQVLIEWKQYQVILGIIHQEEILQHLNIDRFQFINELVNSVLNKLYTNQEILFSQQTKQHIHQILNIYQTQTNYVIQRQNAKLQLAAIFQHWGTNVHLNHIHLLVQEWKTADKQTLIKDLINTYIDQLSFDSFCKLYFFLQKASNQNTIQYDNNQNNTEFINFALYYAQKLLQNQNYTQIACILAYVKSQNSVQISYGLLSQTFLKLVFQKYPTIQTVKSAREAIEYFSQNFDDNNAVKIVYESGLQSARFLSLKEREERIVVSGSFCFRHQHVQVSLDMLWQICVTLHHEKNNPKQIMESSRNIKNSMVQNSKVQKITINSVESLYYTYYFLLMIFRHPDHGFKKNKISYNLQLLTDLMFKLENKIDESADLWCINVYSLFKKYLKSLYLEGLTRIKEVNPQLFHAQFTSKADQSHLQVIKVALKEDRQKNIQLLRCISRIQNFLTAYKAVKKMEKQNRLEKIVLEQERQKQEKQRQQRLLAEMKAKEQQDSMIQEQDDQKITISLKKFNYLKSNISMQSSISGLIHSQKQLMHLIYTQEAQEKKRSHKKIKTQMPNNPFHILLPSYLSRTVKQPLIEKILQDIKNQEWRKLNVEYEKEDLVTAAERMFFSFEMSFKEMIRVLSELDIVDKKKLQTCRLSILYFSENPFISLPSQELKRLFPFSYIVQPCDPNPQIMGQQAYSSLRQQISTLIENKSADFIRQFAIGLGSVLKNNTFIARFCIDVLMLLNKHNFEPENIIKISTIMHLLKGYPQQVRIFAKNILEAFSKNRQLLMIIKQELLNILRDSGEDVSQLEKYIRQFDGR